MSALVVIICVFGCIGIYTFLYRQLWSKKLSCELSFSEKAVTEGQSVFLYETVSNAKWLPLPFVAVKFSMSRNIYTTDTENSFVTDDYYRNDLFSVMSYMRITRKLSFICSRRGYYSIKSVDIVSSDINMVKKLALQCPTHTAITVYPKLVPIDGIDALYMKMYGEIFSRRFINPDPFEFKGIREYCPYDDFKAISFNASAKAQQLMVKVYDYTASQNICLLLNTQPYKASADNILYEYAIRMAASIATHTITDAIPTALIANGRDIATGKELSVQAGQSQSHLQTILESLARLDLQQEVASFTLNLDDIIATSSADTLYILISTYHENDLYTRFTHLLETSAKALWIIPCYADLPVTIPCDTNTICKWEVAYNEQSASLD